MVILQKSVIRFDEVGVFEFLEGCETEIQV